MLSYMVRHTFLWKISQNSQNFIKYKGGVVSGVTGIDKRAETLI